jgi:hypothetical protein
MQPTELHRPAVDSGLFQEVQCADREVLLKDFAGEIRMGDQVCGRRLGILVARLALAWVSRDSQHCMKTKKFTKSRNK